MSDTVATGVLFARYVRAMAIAKGDPMSAEAYAQGQSWWRTTPGVESAIKGAITAVDQDGLSIAMRPVNRDFAEFMRKRTLIGRMAGLRRVPFKVRMLKATAGISAGWIAEGAPIPVQRMQISDVGEQLFPLKCGGISILTMDLMRHSNPVADGVVAADLAAGIVEAMDAQFIDPAAGGVADTSPPSITHDATSFESRGQTVAAIDADLADMLAVLTAAKLSLDTAAWVMSPGTAAHLAGKRGAGSDSLAYPGMTARGGTLMGLPVLTSTACAASGSPGESFVALVEASEILLADDGEADLSVTGTAAVQMDDAPSAGAQQLVSLWENGLVGIRGYRWANWKPRRSGAVAVLRGVTY